jgi:hypothetical protein
VAPRSTAPSGRRLILAGLVLLIASLALYVSGASRATAVWVAPLALLLLGVGGVSFRSGWAPPRWLWVVLVLAMLALAVLGLITLAYALTQRPEAV